MSERWKRIRPWIVAILIVAPTLYFILVGPLRWLGDANEVSAADRKAFIELVLALPHKGEFFTDEAIEKAGPHTRVLLALTEKDIEKYDLYPFLALSRGLCDHKECRSYGATHFDKVAHPEIKLFWAAVLFNEGAATSEIITFLQAALESKDRSTVLSDMLGPEFEDFQQRLKNDHGAG